MQSDRIAGNYNFMGSTISSPANMLSMAGDLRRQAKAEPAPELAAKLQTVAKTLEASALVQVGQTSPHIGKLLDTFA